MNYAGGDLPGGRTATATADACCAACSARLGCGAWTFIPSLYAPGAKGKCFLKRAAGWTRNPNPTTVSGVLKRPCAAWGPSCTACTAAKCTKCRSGYRVAKGRCAKHSG